MLSAVTGRDAQLIQALSIAVTLSATSTGGKKNRYPALKAAIGFIIDAFAGHPIQDEDDIKRDIKRDINSGLISEAEGIYKFMGLTVAREVLQNIGYTVPGLGFSAIAEIPKAEGPKKERNKETTK